MEHEVRSAMAASVWQLRAADGAAVGEGQTLLVLESMKMEIPVPAPADGTVRFDVAEGDLVGEGDLLAVVTAAQTAPAVAAKP